MSNEMQKYESTGIERTDRAELATLAVSDSLPVSESEARAAGVNPENTDAVLALGRAKYKSAVKTLSGDMRERLICYRWEECDEIIADPTVTERERKVALRWKARNAR